MCEIAIARLIEKCRILEEQYGLLTYEFVRKFDEGEIGDEQIFFRWYAYTEAIEDWQTTKNSVQELLGLEVVSVRLL